MDTYTHKDPKVNPVSYLLDCLENPILLSQVYNAVLDAYGKLPILELTAQETIERVIAAGAVFKDELEKAKP